MNKSIVLCIFVFSVFAVGDVETKYEPNYPPKKLGKAVLKREFENLEQPQPQPEQKQQAKRAAACMTDPNYINQDGYYFRVFTGPNVNYTTATAMCAAEGARLPVILSYEKDAAFSQFLYTYNAADDEVWMGLVQVERYRYRWVNNVEFTIDPNTTYSLDGYERIKEEKDKDLTSYDDKDCIVKDDFDDGYTWEDEHCSDDLNRAVCECV